MRHVFALAAVALLAAPAAGYSAENPFKNAKVGDYLEFKQTTEYGASKTEGTLRLTVVKKTDTEVTIEYLTKIGERPDQKQQIPVKLDQDYDPAKGIMQQPEAKIKQVGTGSEQLTLKGKPVETQWTSSEQTLKLRGIEMTNKFKVWTTADVPLGGWIKMETDLMGGGKNTVELTDFGSGK